MSNIISKQCWDTQNHRRRVGMNCQRSSAPASQQLKSSSQQSCLAGICSQILSLLPLWTNCSSAQSPTQQRKNFLCIRKFTDLLNPLNFQLNNLLSTTSCWILPFSELYLKVKTFCVNRYLISSQLLATWALIRLQNWEIDHPLFSRSSLHVAGGIHSGKASKSDAALSTQSPFDCTQLKYLSWFMRERGVQSLIGWEKQN